MSAIPTPDNFRLFGFATGSYMCHCHTCKVEFEGDKRAITCLPCALTRAETAVRQDGSAGDAGAAMRHTLSVQATDKSDRAEGVAALQQAGEQIAENANCSWRPEVRAFADLMEAQLRANDHKPGWKDDADLDLFERLGEESTELLAALHRNAKRLMWGDDWVMEDTVPRVGLEAADVANFAMMIADVCGALALPQQTALVEPYSSDLDDVNGRLA